jgi:hypothetical protein
MEIQAVFMEKAKAQKFEFLAPFLIGVVLLLIGVRYISRHEVADERQERGRRIAAEVSRFKN